MYPLEYGVHALSAAGVPITIAMLRSLQVLLGHLAWLFAGVAILGNVLKPFFGDHKVRAATCIRTLHQSAFRAAKIVLLYKRKCYAENRHTT
jgi:hypothetical protein